MKWYSVRTHKPSVTCSDCMVRTRGGGIKLATNIEMPDGSYQWECFDGDQINDVTHFCIPEPVEIEE
ncbi:hypothetical protein CCP3SC1AL1_1170010 [Gammaproteobacteria bacterium]